MKNGILSRKKWILRLCSALLVTGALVGLNGTESKAWGTPDGLNLYAPSTVVKGIDSTPLEVMYLPNGTSGEVTYAVNDPTIATIDENNKLVPLKNGIVTVTATIVGTEITQTQDVEIVASATFVVHYNYGIIMGDEIEPSQTFTATSFPFEIPYNKIDERINGYYDYPKTYNFTTGQQAPCKVETSGEYLGKPWDEFYEEYRYKPNEYKGVVGTITDFYSVPEKPIDIYIGHVGVFKVEDTHEHVSGDWIVDKEPTTTEAGSQHKVCTLCNIVTETQAIPKLTNEPTTPTDKPTTPTDKPTTPADKPTTPADKPTTPADKSMTPADNPATVETATVPKPVEAGKVTSPKTGDNSNIALSLCVLILSGSAVSIFMYKRKAKKN